MRVICCPTRLILSGHCYSDKGRKTVEVEGGGVPPAQGPAPAQPSGDKCGSVGGWVFSGGGE